MAWWRWKTKTARRVYARKPHPWGARDVERVVRSFSAEAPVEPPMMSQIADRILFWFAQRLGVLEAVSFAAGLLDRIFPLIQGQNPDPVSGQPHSRFLPVLPSPDELVEPSNDPYQVTRLQCEAMLLWLDKEGK